MSEPGLFPEMDHVVASVPEPTKMTPGERRRARHATMFARGIHPLTFIYAPGVLPLHRDAAPHADRAAPGLRCGTCRFRQIVSGGHAGSFPKCLYGDTWDGVPGPHYMPPPRKTSSNASDVAAWWPACRDYEARP